MRACHLAVVLLAAVLTAAPAGAQGSLDGGGPRPIRHGRELAKADVGPRAAGRLPLRTFAGAIMKDGGSYPFAAFVDEPASYEGYEVKEPHWRIENAIISGGLDVYTTYPVVVLGSIVRPAGDALSAIHMRPGSGPLYLLWSEAGGEAGARTEVAVLLRGAPAVIHRSHISETLDGVRLTTSGHRVSETVIDGLVTRPKDHNDGIQTSPQARDIVIERSRIDNANPQTSCILIRGGAITVRDNYLSGGGWVVYGGANGNGHGGKSSDHLTITGNVFGTDRFPKSGSFGPITYWQSRSSNVWSGNRFADGTAVDPPADKPD